jgi:hypothetical protein
MQQCQRRRRDPRAAMAQPEARATAGRYGAASRRPAVRARRGRLTFAPTVRAGEPLVAHPAPREAALEPRVGRGVARTVAQRAEGTARAHAGRIVTTPVRAAPGARRA